MYDLTPSLEDYLESIFITSLNKRIVRVKDIVRHLNVKTSSVVAALRTLAEKKLITHEKYGYVDLTEKGIEIGKSIYERHKLLTKFFNEILGIDLKTSAKDACSIEHHLDKKTIDKLRDFIEFVETSPKKDLLWLSQFRYFVKHKKHPEISSNTEQVAKEEDSDSQTRLSEVKIGQYCEVIKVVATDKIKQRLLAMGLIPGAKVKVEKTSPLGDPIDILVKGYHLSLRKNEAASIIVKVVK